MKNNLIEVCTYSIQSAIIAQAAGADRIELCHNIFEGGTTPSAATIQLVRKLLDINIHVMIRPRGSDFLYSELEFQIMKRDIEIAKDLGIDGVVFGILTDDGLIDEKRIGELIRLSEPLSTTFHRAFDVVKNPLLAIEQLIDLGINRVLTSGQQQTAMIGKDIIKELIDQFGNRIIIMPGSGINELNIQELKNYTGANEFHLSGKSIIKSKMKFRNTLLKMSSTSNISEFERYETDFITVKNVISKINF